MLKRWRTRILLFLAVLGPGFITANVDNDPNGIFTYSQAGRAVRLHPALDHDSGDPGAHRRPGNVRAHGCGDRQRAERPHPRGIWPPHHRHHHGAPGAGEFRQRHRRVCRHCGQPAALSRLQVHLGSDLQRSLVWLLAVRGDYKSVEKIFLFASMFYFTYIIAGVLAHPGWRDAALAPPSKLPRNVSPARFKLCLHGGQRHRHHHRAVDAVLPAVVDRGERA
jgi:hypothetical protein